MTTLTIDLFSSLTASPEPTAGRGTGVLLREGLADYLPLVVFPVVTGQTGLEPIYADWPDLGLDLAAGRTFDGRMQMLTYVPTLH